MVRPRELRLASGSPRRRELLTAAGFNVEVVVPRADETWPGGEPSQAAMALARRKMNSVAQRAAVTVAADTLVILGELPLGKPEDPRDAARMLRSLSGREHRVVTGFCVRGEARTEEGAVVTRVRFRRLSEAEIEWYVETGEPLDKAGAYGIQGRGGALVEWVEGSYTNVVGLPLAEVIAAVESVA